MADASLSAFLWSVAELLRGDFKQSDYGKVILPFTVLRRLDCVLEPTKEAVLKEYAERTKAKVNPEPFLLRKAKVNFYNTSQLDLRRLLGDQDHIGENLRAYVQGFSAPVRDIFERFDFATQIDRLQKAKLLYLVTERFANVDLHPDAVSNADMGLVFEELIRKFAELSNETAGEHFTPREVIRLMVSLIFIEDDDVLSKPGVVRAIYDPTAGTGGMLSIAGEYLAEHNPDARLVMYGHYVYYYDIHQPTEHINWTWFTEASRTLVVDPNGNVELTLFDSDGFDRLHYMFTGRLDSSTLNGGVGAAQGYLDSWLADFDPSEWATPGTVSSDTALASPTEAKLRSSDPGSYVTRKDFNSDGLLTEIWEPGRHVKYVYDTSADQFQKGNLLVKETHPFPSDGDPLVELYAYEPIYNQLRVSVDPRGTTSSFIPPNGGSFSLDRYKTEYIVDYQGASLGAGAVASLVSDWDIDTDQHSYDGLLQTPYGLSASPIPSSLGDENGDSVTSQTMGNPIVIHSPSPFVIDDPLDTSSSPAYTAQTVETTLTYNAYGLATTRTDPEGNVTEYRYQPAAPEYWACPR